MIASAKMSPKDIKSAAKALRGIYYRRLSIPILNQTLVTVSDGKITFLSTNLDQWLTVEYEAETSGTAVFMASFQDIAAFAQAVDGHATLTLTEAKEGALQPDPVLEFSTSNITLRRSDWLDPADFPLPPTTIKPDWRVNAHAVEASQSDLRRALHLGRHCISTEETRYYLNGAFFTRKPDAETLRVVTTDGRRMGVIDTPVPFPANSVIIPTRAVDIITGQLMTGGNEPVSILMGERIVHFEKPGFILATKLIDGTYPDYLRVIPAAAKAGEAQLSQLALKRMANLNKALGGTRYSDCIVDLQAGALRIQSEGGDAATTRIAAKGDFTPLVDFRYLLDQSRATPEFTIQCTANSDPLRCVSSDPDALFLIMPRRRAGGGHQ